MESLLQDLKFGFRQLRKAPAFTAAAILTLALGIGANATIFTWFSSIILNPVPGADGRRLLSIRWSTEKGENRSMSWLDYQDYAKRNHTLEKFAAVGMAPFSLGDGREPERIWGMLVSANYFDTMGVRPALGRAFVQGEDQTPNAVAVISDHLWRTKFGADPALLGREVRINQRNFTVVGIAPQEFAGSILGLRFEVWIPVGMRDALGGGTTLKSRSNQWLVGQARPKTGVSAREINADLTNISMQLAREFDKSGGYNRADAGPIWREGGGSVLGPVMMLLMAVVAVVLLIACANVANLLLARGAGRRKELSIRLALGVGRARLIRQLLIENAVLASGGLAGALAILPLTIGTLNKFAPPTDLPIGLTIHTDSGVFLFTIAISAAATAVFGLLPALRASSPDVVAALKDESGTSSRKKLRLGNALVVAQVALSLVLLVSAGLFLKSLKRATSTDPGFDPRNVLIAGVDLQPNGYDAARARVAVREMMGKISAIPGVVAASTTRFVPLSWNGSSSASFQAEGYVPAKLEEPNTGMMFVGADFFHAIGTPIVQGREFGPADTPDAQHVVVINQTFARRYFASSDPIGRRVRIYGEQRVVVGVSRNSKHDSIDKEPGPFLYIPSEQFFASETNFLIRTAGDPMGYARAAEDAIHSVDPALAVYGVRPLEAAISASYMGQRIGGSFLGLFGVCALVLASVGLYGVLAYTVSQRSREVGIRMALGASRWDVLGMILRQGLQLATLGLGAGLAIAVGVTRFMRAMLLDISPTDLPTLALVCALLIAVAVGASFLPAYRAARIDPILAIRHD
ncbi:MAG: ABC transporter permease [Acidobacteriia bacterium]|nr:ABC transporter permease [Terriglobia bacterium]